MRLRWTLRLAKLSYFKSIRLNYRIKIKIYSCCNGLEFSINIKTFYHTVLKEFQGTLIHFQRILIDDSWKRILDCKLYFQVYENEQLKTQMTNQRPFFEVARVDFNQPVKLFVFAQNAKGSSEPFIIEETGNAKKHAVEGRSNLVISKSIFLNVPRPKKFVAIKTKFIH